MGITLAIFGPEGIDGGKRLAAFGGALGAGTAAFTSMPVTRTGALTIDGKPAPEGWLVQPHDAADGSLTAADVQRQILQGIQQSNITRAAIRLGLSVSARMVLAISDKTGEVLGLFRMPDATIFSIDVAVSKSRNAAYYANADLLQPGDQLAGIPKGVAFTARSFRYLTLPRFPSSIDSAPPAPFSVLNDGGVDRKTALNVGPPLPASAFLSVEGRDAFNPGTNFFEGGPLPSPDVIRKQSGIIFFPGSSALYRLVNGKGVLIGGLGVSGDGVDQDDVVTTAAANGLAALGVARADDFFINGVRIPYQKFNRNALGIA